MATAKEVIMATASVDSPRDVVLAPMYDATYRSWVSRPHLELLLGRRLFTALPGRDKVPGYTEDEQRAHMEQIAHSVKTVIAQANAVIQERTKEGSEAAQEMKKKAFVFMGPRYGSGLSQVGQHYLEEEKLTFLPFISQENLILSHPACQAQTQSEGLRKTYRELSCFATASTTIQLSHLIREGLPFCYRGNDPQSTNPLLDHLKRESYRVTVIHVTESPEDCYASLPEQTRELMQIKIDDLKAEAGTLAKNMSHVMECAEKIHFYVRQGMTQPRYALEWLHLDPNPKGYLAIHDAQAYAAFQATHTKHLRYLGIPEENKQHLQWNFLVRKYVGTIF